MLTFPVILGLTLMVSMASASVLPPVAEPILMELTKRIDGNTAANVALSPDTLRAHVSAIKQYV